MQTSSRVTDDSNRRNSQPAEHKPKLLDQVRQAIRARHYSKRTEKTYVDWLKRFIFFHGKRHPLEMDEPEINPVPNRPRSQQEGQRVYSESGFECDLVSLPASPGQTP